VKTLAVIALALVCLPLLAADEDLSVLMEKLGNESFEVREDATSKLINYPLEYAGTFLDMAKEAKDPEVQYRLGVIAREIFFQRVVRTDRRWKVELGCFTFDYNPYIFPRPKEGVFYNIRRFLGYGVECLLVWKPGSGIRKYDLIMKIDGVDIKGMELSHVIEAGREYVLTIRRYTDEDLKKIEEDYSISADDKNYTEMDVKVVAGWKSVSQLTYDETEYCIQLEEMLWNGFLEQRKQPKESK